MVCCDLTPSHACHRAHLGQEQTDDDADRGDHRPGCSAQGCHGLTDEAQTRDDRLDEQDGALTVPIGECPHDRGADGDGSGNGSGRSTPGTHAPCHQGAGHQQHGSHLAHGQRQPSQ